MYLYTGRKACLRMSAASLSAEEGSRPQSPRNIEQGHNEIVTPQKLTGYLLIFLFYKLLIVRNFWDSRIIRPRVVQFGNLNLKVTAHRFHYGLGWSNQW